MFCKNNIVHILPLKFLNEALELYTLSEQQLCIVDEVIGRLATGQMYKALILCAFLNKFC